MDVGKKAHSYIAGGVANWCSHSRKQCGDSSENLEWTHLLAQLSHSCLYPKDLKLAYYSNSTTSMFIAVQCTIARLWIQPKCPSTDEWIKKLCCIYTMEYYSVIKKNNIMAFADKWMELENIMLSELNQFQKAKG